MILEFHDSIFIKNKEEGLSEDEQCQFSYILRMRRFGKAFILADMRRLVEFNESDLSNQERSVISKVISDLTQWKNWLIEQTFRIVVTCLNDEDNQHLSTQTGFPHLNIMQIDFEKSALLTENLNDAIFYKYLLDKYIGESLNLKGVLTNLELKHGGGSTTAQVLNEHQAESRTPVFCIVDSDKSEPRSPIGTTAQKIFDDVEVQHTTQVYCIEAREAENFLPLDFLRSFFSESPQRATVERLSAIYEAQLEGVRPYIYFDVKKGLVKADISGNVSLEARQFWRSVLTSLNKDLDECQCTSPKRCNCVVINGLGSDLLRKVSDKIKNGECNSFNFFDDSVLLVEDIKLMCKKLMPFAIAPLRVVA